jgi:hypothetical protein
MKMHGNKMHDRDDNDHSHGGGKHGFPPDRGNPFVNVKSAPYKAKGDGTTDDTAAIQLAANTALAQHKFLFFPAGTYLHTGTLTFNGIAVTGVGAPTTLLANNEESSAVILTGANPSIDNLVVSTQGLTDNNEPFPDANEGSIVVQGASGFTVGNVTILQGVNEIGVFVNMSSAGTVNSVLFNGTGNPGDVGVFIDQSSNVNVVGNLFQNEDIGVEVSAAGMASQTITVLLNTIGNTSFPSRTAGVQVSGAGTFSISQNTIQMASMSGTTTPISLTNCDNFFVAQNTTNGGAQGVSVSGAGANNGNSVQGNSIQNCGGAGLFLNNAASTAIQLNGNVLAQCGLNDTGSNNPNNAVILVTGSSSSGNTTVIINNAYQGAANGLNFYISSLFHIPAGNVTGNTQTTALPNNLP